jgi:iron complex transport system substrate-binding protein
LVGRTRFCVYPPDIKDVTSIGALNDVNVEALLAIGPDVIIVSGQSRAQRERFDALKIRFETVPDTTLEDLFRAIRQIGGLTGRPRTANRLCESIDRDLDEVDRRRAKVAPARVLLLTGTMCDPPRPPYVAGPGSFYDALIKRAGHTNVVKTDAAFAPLGLESIIKADPDVIIELDPDGSGRPGGDAGARRVWAKVGALRAVVDRRVRVLIGQEHFLLGPRIALTYDALCTAIAEPSDD